MKYSFIIPTLNEEKLLSNILDQIKSISNEIECEIIISDGGSSDKTLEIANSFTHKIILHGKSGKQTIAEGRHDGAKEATGEILVFINADVKIKDTFKFIMEIKKFEKSNALAMTCNVRVFEDEEILSDKLFLTFYNNYFHFLNIIGLGMGRGECQIVKKDIYEKLGGYNIKLAAGEDFELYKRIRKLGGIMFSRKLTILESPRRYRKEGHWRILFKWFFNSILVIFTNKSFSDDWEQVR
ncbi:MAG: glycosyltransferase [Melioribacteraceae bacterium]|nr:glycosyltransferase [Melioribacteraceae bacterium]